MSSRSSRPSEQTFPVPDSGLSSPRNTLDDAQPWNMRQPQERQHHEATAETSHSIGLSPPAHDIPPGHLHAFPSLPISPEAILSSLPTPPILHPPGMVLATPTAQDPGVTPSFPSSPGSQLSGSPSHSVLKQSSAKTSHRTEPYPQTAASRVKSRGAAPSKSTGRKTSHPGADPERDHGPHDVSMPQPLQHRFRPDYADPSGSTIGGGSLGGQTVGPSTPEPSTSQRQSSSAFPVDIASVSSLREFAVLPQPSSSLPPSSTPIQQHTAAPLATTQLNTPQPQPQTARPRTRMNITTDMHFDSTSRVLTAMFELPGVRRQDISITLSTSIYNCVRQLRISGWSHPVFPPAVQVSERDHQHGQSPAIHRERRFGEFSRTFPVHPFMTLNDIDATLHAGILTLTMRCGTPATSADEASVPIREL